MQLGNRTPGRVIVSRPGVQRPFHQLYFLCAFNSLHPCLIDSEARAGIFGVGTLTIKDYKTVRCDKSNSSINIRR
jgi:hypothetical protein